MNSIINKKELTLTQGFSLEVGGSPPVSGSPPTGKYITRESGKAEGSVLFLVLLR